MENVGWEQGLNFFLFVFFELFCGSNPSLLDDELNILKIGSCWYLPEKNEGFWIFCFTAAPHKAEVGV